MATSISRPLYGGSNLTQIGAVPCEKCSKKSITKAGPCVPHLEATRSHALLIPFVYFCIVSHGNGSTSLQPRSLAAQGEEMLPCGTSKLFIAPTGPHDGTGSQKPIGILRILVHPWNTNALIALSDWHHVPKKCLCLALRNFTCHFTAQGKGDNGSQVTDSMPATGVLHLRRRLEHRPVLRIHILIFGT